MDNIITMNSLSNTFDSIPAFSFDRSNPDLSEYPENEYHVEESEDENQDNMEKEKQPLVETTKEILQRIQHELCLIKLCWPEVNMTDVLYTRSLSDTYRSVSDKEKLLLWYAENFRRQFHTKYINRKPLLLACENEYGVQKFVSTTIQRGILAKRYPKLYTWQGCTNFIFDYIKYEVFINKSKTKLRGNGNGSVDKVSILFDTRNLKLESLLDQPKQKRKKW